MLNAAQVQIRLQQAQTFAQSGLMRDSWALLLPLRAAIDANGPALRLYALVAQQVGQVDAAIGALKRILTVEREPPEILGAIADTLDKAGLHDEAYGFWSRLVEKQPGAIDAHLNRTISADSAGRHDDAVRAADQGLGRSPRNARLLAAKGAALRNGARVAEAVEVFAAAVQADPDRALTRYNQAVTLRVACRYEEACDAYAEAERLGSTGSIFQANWAAAALEAGRVDEAAERYRVALKTQPELEEARRGLTRLLIEYRGGEAAFDHYEHAARSANLPQAWTDYQLALLANKKFKEAAEVGREAIAILGRDPVILRGTLFAEGITGNAGAALDELDRLAPLYRDDSMGLIARAQLALRAHRAEVCVERCLEYNVLQPHEQSGWSLLTLAWRMLDDPHEHWLCDYERLVMPVDVPAFDDATNPVEYARVVAAALDPLHTAIAEPGDQSLRNGTQTSGDLFARPDAAIQRFRRSVIDAAIRAVSNLPIDPQHPFLGRNSGRVAFSGSWSVRLAGGGGHHIPHFHGQGWMSSAYYARLPQTDPDGKARHEGWIEFGRSPEMFRLDFEPRRTVEPREGRLVLFPSFLWHGTVSFPGGRGDRLTAAFDYLPL
jgi:tetratricopeptide (TPR) repeat protein